MDIKIIVLSDKNCEEIHFQWVLLFFIPMV